MTPRILLTQFLTCLWSGYYSIFRNIAIMYSKPIWWVYNVDFCFFRDNFFIGSRFNEKMMIWQVLHDSQRAKRVLNHVKRVQNHHFQVKSWPYKKVSKKTKIQVKNSPYRFFNFVPLFPHYETKWNWPKIGQNWPKSAQNRSKSG